MDMESEGSPLEQAADITLDSQRSDTLEILLKDREEKLARIAALQFELAQQKSHTAFLEVAVQKLRDNVEDRIGDPLNVALGGPSRRIKNDAAIGNLEELLESKEDLASKHVSDRVNETRNDDCDQEVLCLGEPMRKDSASESPSVQLDRQVLDGLLQDREAKSALIEKLNFELRQQRRQTSFFESEVRNLRHDFEGAVDFTRPDCHASEATSDILKSVTLVESGVEPELECRPASVDLEGDRSSEGQRECSAMTATEEDALLEREGLRDLLRDREEKLALTSNLRRALKQQASLFDVIVSQLCKEVESAESLLQNGTTFLKSAERSLEAAGNNVEVLSKTLEEAAARVSCLEDTRRFSRSKKSIKQTLTRWLVCGNTRSIQKYV
jgi:hypothetical protein